MESNKTNRLVPYDRMEPGFEAVYTGETSSSPMNKDDLIGKLYTDEAGNIIRNWPVFTWTWQGKASSLEDQMNLINNMQKKLGPLDDDVRQIRAHIGSLVPCDSGLPVTVDELLNAIGRGKLQEPSFHNGCWNCAMWWPQKSTQPSHRNSMKVIHAVLTGYCAGKSRQEAASEFPHAEGFINRMHEWLGPAEAFSEVQALMMERMLLVIAFFSKMSDTESAYIWGDERILKRGEAAAKDCFEEGGRGSEIDGAIAGKAGLPRIHQHWKAEYKESLESIKDANKRELYKTCAAMASGVYSLSDCHHNTFRVIESWLHGIGTGVLSIPTRKAGAERERVGRLLFGYVLGIDKWLLEVPLQFLLMDLGHVDLGFDPKNEIARVYAYLGGERNPVKEWLAACLWHGLMYNLMEENYPAGLVQHKDLIELADRSGIKMSEWMDAALEA